jgi:CxxC-x17-CxxC domain-containing protein
MSFQNKTLKCSDCAFTFTFSVDEQELFASRGHTNEPKRCPSCRQARKARQQSNNSNSFGSNSHNYNSPRQMFPVKCSDCGKDTEVPFKPTNGRPVYCSDCYRKVRLSI